MNRRSFLSLAGAAPFLTFAAQGQAAPSGKSYRACVIGDSNNGGYGHSLHMLWAMRDDVEVVGLADPDEAGREKHANEAGAKHSYADYREMLAKEKPDLVAIGPRSTDRHLEYLLACAEAGAHGIIEKPLTPSLAEADQAIAAMEAKDLKWAIAFNFRVSPVMQHAKKLIFEEGLIGEVLEMRGRGKEDSRAGGEDLIVLGTHIFDLMIDFAGRPQWCAATITQDGDPVTPEDVKEATEPLGPIVGDNIHAMFGFADGVPGYFSSRKNPAGNVGRWGLDIYGTKGIVTIRMAPVPEIRVLDSPSWTGKEADWRPLPDAPEVAFDHRVGYYKPIVDGLIAAIESGNDPLANLKDGRNALEMVQAVFACPKNGGRVELPLKERAHPLAEWS